MTHLPPILGGGLCKGGGDRFARGFRKAKKKKKDYQFSSPG